MPQGPSENALQSPAYPSGYIKIDESGYCRIPLPAATVDTYECEGSAAVKISQFKACLVMCSSALVSLPLQGFAQQSSETAKAGAQQPVAERDG